MEVAREEVTSFSGSILFPGREKSLGARLDKKDNLDWSPVGRGRGKIFLVQAT